jgi:hypothetical protein
LINLFVPPEAETRASPVVLAGGLGRLDEAALAFEACPATGNFEADASFYQAVARSGMPCCSSIAPPSSLPAKR